MTRPAAPMMAGCLLLAVLALGAAAAPLIARGAPGRMPAPDPLRMDQQHVLAAPGGAHWLGTDQLGRDVLSRLLHGARPSLVAGLTATVVAMALGLLLGAIAGRSSGWIDGVLSRGTEVVYAFPPLVGALAVLGGPLAGRSGGFPQGIRLGVVIGIFGWPSLFRLIRVEVRRLLETDALIAARASGAGPARITARHLLPAAMTPALVPASFLAAGAILVEAGLGFLGVGVEPPAPSWGGLLRDGMIHVDAAWWLPLFPGLAVFAAVLACQLIGDALSRGARR